MNPLLGMMLDKAMGKILVLKYLLCYSHISILIALKQLRTDVPNPENHQVDHFTLLSYSYLAESLVPTWKEPEYIYAI